MAVVEFVVFNQLAQPTDQRILVVLPSKEPPDDAHLCAWQVLNPPPKMGQQSFQYTGRVEVTAAEDRAQGSRSAPRTALPGSRFQAPSRRGQGPELLLTEIRNDPRIELANPDSDDQPTLRAIWSSGGRPFLKQHGVAPGSSVGVELVEDVLVFRIAKPPANGSCPPAEADQPVYEYRIPAGTSRVEVTWTETDDGFELEFAPPSEDPPDDADARPKEQPAPRRKAKRSKKKEG